MPVLQTNRTPQQSQPPRMRFYQKGDLEKTFNTADQWNAMRELRLDLSTSWVAILFAPMLCVHAYCPLIVRKIVQ